jgi:hypothetical protein
MRILSDADYQELMRIKQEYDAITDKLHAWLNGINNLYRSNTELYANTATILIIEKLEELLR